jgi:hypothetical protein
MKHKNKGFEIGEIPTNLKAVKKVKSIRGHHSRVRNSQVGKGGLPPLA